MVFSRIGDITAKVGRLRLPDKSRKLFHTIAKLVVSRHGVIIADAVHKVHDKLTL